MSTINTKNRPDISSKAQTTELENQKDKGTIAEDALKLRAELEGKAKVYEKLIKHGAMEEKSAEVIQSRINRAIRDLDTILGLCEEESV
jgi:hypothetical protein